MDLRTILDSINDGVFTVDGGFRVTSFNRAAAEITGVSATAALAQPCCEVFRADICEGECALKETLESGAPIVNKQVNILTASGQRLPISVSTALLRDANGAVVGGVETFRDMTLVEELRKAVHGRATFQDIISASHRMQEVFKLLPIIAESDSTVLILGESGTGKELMARALHKLSPRFPKPLVTLNCGALPDTLLEAELFGHKAGAFTDAKKERKGRIAAAEGGTLFLDEIGDISPATQVRLLRVLQERTYEPLGSNGTLKANVRFVAATHKDLRAEMEAGRFREDLYYRLNVLQIAIPPLRERAEDIPALAHRFLEKQNGLHGKQVRGFTPEAMAALMRYGWPGNIRELENAVEHACVLCRHTLIRPECLPPTLAAPWRARADVPAAPDLKGMERTMILAAMERHGGNRVEVAKELGINKTTLWRKLKRI
ncbi:sigma-54 interaction domain-containing protein [Mesoterricola silvestris]|uniref:sigma-54 interaction domain-containing protein n=1 Tax=Mesoterricola silvestris TaxID=2927979 RepID=UPI00292D53B9|nr:sigma 54-interacting transcriptional regulator [Mesoterricola silvestris]